LARVLSRLPQVEDRGLLLLEGLAQVLVRDAELGQLPVEPRDLVIPLLEGRLRPLKCSMLLLKPALRLFPCQMLALEGDPGLDKGGPLQLELGLRLRARDLFQPELLLRRGERDGLVRQAGPQLLRLFGLIFNLALPRSRSLEGCTVLLELGPNRGHLGLPLCRQALRPRQILSRLVQCLVPVHERRLHPLDRGDVLRSLGVQLRRLIPQGFRQVHQPKVMGPKGLDEGVEGVVLPPVPAELVVQPVESAVPLLGPTLQFLPPAGKAKEDRGKGERKRGRNKSGKTTKPGEKSQTWKMRHAGPPRIRSASFNARLSEAPWSRNSCHSASSTWALAKWAGGILTRSRSCSGRAAVPSEAGRVARDDEASTPCVGRPDITQPSSLITSTPTGGSRDGAARLSH
jgi:hypothetical protein